MFVFIAMAGSSGWQEERVGGWGGTMAKIVTFDVVAKGSYTHSSKNIFVYIADG